MLGLCGGGGGQQEAWAKSEDCSKGCWENPLHGRKSIRVARGNSSAWLFQALSPGFPPPLPSCRASTREEGGAGHSIPLQGPSEWPQHRGGGAPWTLADLHCYSQRVQGAEALEGIGSDLCNLVVAQVSAKCAGGKMAESRGGHQALLGPSSQMPWEGRHFFDIRKMRGQFSYPPEMPRPLFPRAVRESCSGQEVQPWSPFLIKLYPASQFPLHPLSRPSSAPAEIGG